MQNLTDQADSLTSPPKYLEWVDLAKGFSITLVVLGHLISSQYHAGLGISKHFFEVCDSYGNAFRMPLFFFMAGLFTKRSLAKRGTRVFVKDKLIALGYPFVVWSLLQMSVEMILSQYSNHTVTVRDILLIFIYPWEQFWFSHSLFVMFLLYALLARVIRKCDAVCIILGFILQFFPINTDIFAMSKFSAMALFFMGGAILREHPLLNHVPRHVGKIALGLWILYFSVASLLFGHMVPYVRLAAGGHPWALLLLSFIGVPASIYAMQFWAKNGGHFLTPIGKRSLEIYVAHMLFGVGARVLLFEYLPQLSPYAILLLSIGVGVGGPVILGSTLRRLRFPYLFSIT